MPNTKSAKKAIRSSERKKQFNLIWKKRIKEITKSLKSHIETKDLDVDILNKELSVLQKVLDKAAKNDVIHKNKADRLKSRYAQKIAARTEKKGKKSSSKESTTGSKSSGGKRS